MEQKSEEKPGFDMYCWVLIVVYERIIFSFRKKKIEPFLMTRNVYFTRAVYFLAVQHVSLQQNIQ